jgi:hypothetical protein
LRQSEPLRKPRNITGQPGNLARPLKEVLTGSLRRGVSAALLGRKPSAVPNRSRLKSGCHRTPRWKPLLDSPLSLAAVSRTPLAHCASTDRRVRAETCVPASRAGSGGEVSPSAATVPCGRAEPLVRAPASAATSSHSPTGALRAAQPTQTRGCLPASVLPRRTPLPAGRLVRLRCAAKGARGVATQETERTGAGTACWPAATCVLPADRDP